MGAAEVTLNKNHVTVTIVSFVGMVIFIIMASSAASSKLTEYKSRLIALEHQVELQQAELSKLDDLELRTRLLSIDNRLKNIEETTKEKSLLELYKEMMAPKEKKK